MAQPRETQAAEQPAGDSHLTNWVLPVAGIVAFAAMAGAFFLGWISEAAVGGFAGLAFAGLLAGLAIRAAFDKASGAFRAAGIVFGLLVFLVTLEPVQPLVAPGAPAADAVLHPDGDARLDAPGSGTFRVVTSAVLPPGGSPAAVAYRLRAGDSSISGRLERVLGTRRARRGAAITVPEDHSVQVHEAKLSSGAAVTLESLTGDGAAHGLRVRLYPVLPFAALVAAMVAAVLFAMALEGLSRAKNAFTMSAAAAVSFVLLLRTGDPSTVMGAVFGSILIGAGGGALGGALLGAIARAILGSRAAAKADKPAPGRSERAGKPA